jgi:hypothetical protein
MRALSACECNSICVYVPPYHHSIFLHTNSEKSSKCRLEPTQTPTTSKKLCRRYGPIWPKLKRHGVSSATCRDMSATFPAKVDYHVYPSGRKVIKAFIANDFQFIDVTGQVITELSVASIDVVDRVRITWRIQKNRQNNQKVTLSRDKTNPAICPVLAALRLVLRAHHLSQPDSMPVACYLKKDAMAYLTGSRIAFHFRAAARAAHPNISKDEEQ